MMHLASKWNLMYLVAKRPARVKLLKTKTTSIPTDEETPVVKSFRLRLRRLRCLNHAATR